MAVTVKMGGKYFEMDEKSLELTAIETPENVEELDVFDGDKLSSYVESSYAGDPSADSEGVIEKHNEKVRAYQTARSEAKTLDEHAAAKALKPEIAVFKHMIDAKEAAFAEAGADIDVKETAKAEDAKAEDAKAESETEEAPEADKAEATEDAEKAETSETVEETAPVTDEAIAELLDSEGVAAKELVQAASKIVAKDVKDRIQADEIIDPSKASGRSETRQRAPYMTAGVGLSGRETMDTGTSEAWDVMAENYNRAMSANKGEGVTPLGGFKTFTEDVKSVTASAMLEPEGLTQTARLASGECEYLDDRTDFAACDYWSNDLFSLVPVLQSDSCNIRFRTDFSQWEMAPGITYWSKERHAAMCQAQTDLQAALDAGDDAAITAAQIAILKLQKRCAEIPEICPTEPSTYEEIAACVNFSTRKQDCQPEDIRRGIGYLEHMLQRAKNSYFLRRLDECSVTVNVDLCQVCPGVDAYFGVNEAIGNVISKIDEAEGRLPGTNWTAIGSPRFLQHLGTGLKKAHGENLLGFTADGIDGISSFVPTVDALWDPADPQQLLTQPTFAYPQPGDTLDYAADCAYPTTYEVYVFNPSGFFALGSGERRLDAVFNHESAKSNMVNGPFMEERVSLNKFGCDAVYKFVFTNVNTNGAKVAPVPANNICA